MSVEFQPEDNNEESFTQEPPPQEPFTQDDFEEIVERTIAEKRLELQNPSMMAVILNQIYAIISPSPEIPNNEFAWKMWTDYHNGNPGSYIMMHSDPIIWGNAINTAQAKMGDTSLWIPEQLPNVMPALLPLGQVYRSPKHRSLGAVQLVNNYFGLFNITENSTFSVITNNIPLATIIPSSPTGILQLQHFLHHGKNEFLGFEKIVDDLDTIPDGSMGLIREIIKQSEKYEARLHAKRQYNRSNLLSR